MNGLACTELLLLVNRSGLFTSAAVYRRVQEGRALSQRPTRSSCRARATSSVSRASASDRSATDAAEL